MPSLQPVLSIGVKCFFVTLFTNINVMVKRSVSDHLAFLYRRIYWVFLMDYELVANLRLKGSVNRGPRGMEV